jgi:penicillin-binding protein 1C
LGEFKPYALLESGTPAPRAGTRVFDSAASYLIADILSDNAARTLAFGAESSLSFDFPVACKTGTSSDFRDNWAFGYTPEFTVGVWVGNFDGSPMQEISGVTGAAPILHDLIEHLHQRFGTTWYQSPANIVERQIHPITGKQFDAFLDPERVSVREKFIANHLPAVTAIEDFDVSGKIRLPAEYAPWLATGDNWLAGRAVVAGRMADLRIVFPLPGTTFYLDPDLPDSGRRIHLQAEGGAMAEWRSGTLSFAQDRGQTFALLDKGRHQLTVRDLQSGVERKTWIEVLER